MLIVENILLVVENILLVVGCFWFSPLGLDHILDKGYSVFSSPLSHFVQGLNNHDLSLTLPNFCETFFRKGRCPLSSFSDLLSTETRPTTMNSETKGWKIVQLEWLLQNPSISCIPAGQTSRYTAPPLPSPPSPFLPSPQTPFCSLTPTPPPRSDRAAEETELIRESTVIPDTSSYVAHQYFQEVGHRRSPRNKISKECQR